MQSELKKSGNLSSKNWFNAAKVTSFTVLLFSFIPTINFSFLFGAYDAVRTTRTTDILFYIIQGIIGLAFGITFFAPLWARLPVKTENDFLSFRYTGKFVTPLKKARALLLGLFIIPLLMAVVFKAPISLLTELGINHQKIGLIILGILLFYGFKNSIANRITFDFLTGLLLVFLCIICIPVLLNVPQLHTLKLSLSESKNASSNLFMAATVTWWFSNIVDFPDMRAQKLLSAKSARSGYLSFLIGNGIMLFLQGIMLCVYAVFRGHHNEFFQWMCIVILFISSLIQLMNLQHWSGNLMHCFFAKATSYLRLQNYLPMLVSIGIACIICSLTDSLFQLVQGILFFSAGVGPVYVLRWTSSRINALTQLTAMISSLVLGIIYISLSTSEILDESAIHWLGLSESNTVVLVLGFINCLIWLSVMVLSQNKKERDAANIILQEIHASNHKSLSIKLVQFALTAVVLMALFFGPYLIIIGV